MALVVTKISTPASSRGSFPEHEPSEVRGRIQGVDSSDFYNGVMKCPCGHPIDEHSRYIGCMVVVEEGRPGRDVEGRDDTPEVFCACPAKGRLEDIEDEEEGE